MCSSETVQQPGSTTRWHCFNMNIQSLQAPAVTSNQHHGLNSDKFQFEQKMFAFTFTMYLMSIILICCFSFGGKKSPSLSLSLRGAQSQWPVPMPGGALHPAYNCVPWLRFQPGCRPGKCCPQCTAVPQNHGRWEMTLFH